MTHSGGAAYCMTCTRAHYQLDDPAEGETTVQYKPSVNVPSKPLQPCKAPGCAALVLAGYCDAHRRASPSRIYDATTRRDDPKRAEAARIRSSAAWQHVRRLILATQPWCRDPFGCHKPAPAFADQVHHMHPLHERPDLAFDPTNLAPLCTRCHGRIEALERAGQPTAHFFTNPPYPTAASATPGRVEKSGAPRPTPIVLPFSHVRKM